jgi:hypothetical protein
MPVTRSSPADVATAVPVRRMRGRIHRLIATRWPTVGVFDTVATPDDARDALVLESWTNDRVTVDLDRLTRLPDDEWVAGKPGATLVMAAFCYPAPGGGRFSSDRLGAWYAAREVETAIAETVYHHRRRLGLSAMGFHATIQMRELGAEVDARFHDIRGHRRARPDLYDPGSYGRSQPFGEGLRALGSNGILFDSVRREGGRNLVVFRPKLLVPLYEGDRYDYRWTGASEPAVARLEGGGRDLSAEVVRHERSRDDLGVRHQAVTSDRSAALGGAASCAWRAVLRRSARVPYSQCAGPIRANIAGAKGASAIGARIANTVANAPTPMLTMCCPVMARMSNDSSASSPSASRFRYPWRYNSVLCVTSVSPESLPWLR